MGLRNAVKQGAVRPPGVPAVRAVVNGTPVQKA
jgi:hypothetical protein